MRSFTNEEILQAIGDQINKIPEDKTLKDLIKYYGEDFSLKTFLASHLTPIEQKALGLLYTKSYKYTYKYRGYSIGCQPKEGFIKYVPRESGMSYGTIFYNRTLTVEEIEEYELIDLNK